MKIITSLANPLIKKIVALHTKEGRKTQGLCLVEGERAVETFLQSKLEPEILCVTETTCAWAKNRLACNDPHTLNDLSADPCFAKATPGSSRRSAKITCPDILCVSPAVMKRISTATTPSGIVGIFKIPQHPKNSIGQGLVLAQIQDPGNMGTLIRTAVALNAPTIIIVEGTDPWSPKVIQASAGTIAQAVLYQLSWQELLQKKGATQLVALVVSGGKSLEKLDLCNSLLVVGNEANGLPTQWQQDCEEKATLSMPGNAESLNAAAAGSIALYIAYAKMSILKIN
jgi:TrmH family RNA methyltransferase